MPSRRQFLGAALSGATSAALSLPACSTSAPANSNMAPLDNDADLERLLPALSNWGRWGPEDQLGTLNYITPAMRLSAARLIRSGHVIPLAREMPVAGAEGVRKQTYEMNRYVDPQPGESGSMDTIGMNYHGFSITHIDALCHFFTPEGKQGMYNGFSIDAVTPHGAEKLGVEVMGATGIVGRGVLLDIAALKGRSLEAGTAIFPADLDAAERRQQVQLGEGDILFVRSGSQRSGLQRGTGLHASCLPWLHQRRVALLGSDSDNDVHPAAPGFARWSEPVHMVALPYFGMPLLDNAELDALGARCAQENRWAFFVSIAPWRFKGATSSPVNPLAMF